jgi:WD40 repeat protein
MSLLRSSISTLAFRWALAFALAALACGSDCVERNPIRPYPQPCPPCISGIGLVVDYPLDISPDGQWVLYAHRGSQSYPEAIYSVSSSGAGVPDSVMPLAVFSLDPSGLRYSPDGGSLVLVRGPLSDLWVRDLSSGTETRITFTNGNAADPDWDPTGRYVVYSRSFLSAGDPDSSGGLHVVDVQSLNDRVLRYQGQVVFGVRPRWSPDGAWIAYWQGVRTGESVHAASAARVFAIAPDGSAIRQLTDSNGRNEMYPEWLGGSVRLLFESYDQVTPALHETDVVPLNGGTPAPWPIDLVLPRSALSRNGATFAYIGPDSSGRFGVVRLRESRDTEGTTDHQITSFVLP